MQSNDKVKSSQESVVIEDAGPGVAGARLKASLFVPLPRPDVFAFFSNPSNLSLLTPEALRFQILSAEPVAMIPGQKIDYRLRIRGIPLKWQSLITRIDAPKEFVDVQTKGPYRRFEHTHRFHEAEGGTLVEDEVLFDAPCGRLARWLVIDRELLSVFNFRHQRLRELLAKNHGRLP